jgi:hypothetical protein
MTQSHPSKSSNLRNKEKPWAEGEEDEEVRDMVDAANMEATRPLHFESGDGKKKRALGSQKLM